VAIGNAILVGTSTDRIIETTLRLLGDDAALAAMSQRSFPYGDGKAGPRIAAIIEHWIETSSRRRKSRTNMLNRL
jgi:UDP-N-acetylglucosamine 2-epimerase (non-hydrolysing)